MFATDGSNEVECRDKDTIKTSHDLGAKSRQTKNEKKKNKSPIKGSLSPATLIGKNLEFKAEN